MLSRMGPSAGLSDLSLGGWACEWNVYSDKSPEIQQKDGNSIAKPAHSKKKGKRNKNTYPTPTTLRTALARRHSIKTTQQNISDRRRIDGTCPMGWGFGEGVGSMCGC